MKTNRLMKAAALAMMLLAGPAMAQAQDLNKILGGITGNSSSSEGDDSTGSLINSLTSVFSSKKQATTENLVGTWVYEEPAIVLKSDNVLTNAAAKVAANKVEKQLQTQLSKYGIQKGTLTMEFKSDGTFTSTIKGKKSSGKWTVQDSKLQLTLASVKTVSVTTQLSGSNLQFVTDATKLLELFKAVGSSSGNSQLSTVTSLMKSVNGMQAGLTLKKQ